MAHVVLWVASEMELHEVLEFCFERAATLVKKIPKKRIATPERKRIQFSGEKCVVSS